MEAAKEAERAGQASRRARRRGGQALLRKGQRGCTEEPTRTPSRRQGADGKASSAETEEELSALRRGPRRAGHGAIPGWVRCHATPAGASRAGRANHDQHARLAGRLALVTGATRGIGRAVALAYAREGAHVILVGRTAGALEEVDDEIRAIGGKATLAHPRPQGPRQDRRARAHHLPALGQARHPRRQCRHPRAAVAPGAYHGRRLGRGDRDQPDGQLAPDPHARPAAAPLGRRPRHLRVLGRRAARRVPTGDPTPPPRRGSRRWSRLRRRGRNTPVRVNLVNPGPTRTGMRAKAFPGEDPASLRPPEHAVETFVRLAEATCTDNGRLFDLKMSQAQ